MSHHGLNTQMDSLFVQLLFYKITLQHLLSSLFAAKPVL